MMPQTAEIYRTIIFCQCFNREKDCPLKHRQCEKLYVLIAICLSDLRVRQKQHNRQPQIKMDSRFCEVQIELHRARYIIQVRISQSKSDVTLVQ